MKKKPTEFDKDLFDPWVDKCCETLRNDGTILYPTDTIWGIGCDATNELALERIFNLKKRPRDKPFVLLARDIEMIEKYVVQIPPKIDQILFYNKRPMTVIYPGAKNLPNIAIHSTGSIAFRIPHDPFCQALLEKFDRPLAATSANIANKPFPKNYGEISSKVLANVDYIVPYRQVEKENGKPSVMVRLSDKGELVFLRE